MAAITPTHPSPIEGEGFWADRRRGIIAYSDGVYPCFGYSSQYWRKPRWVASLCGWARNRSDGAVEAVLEGSRGAVDRLVDFCRRGPSRAEVDDVEVSEEEPEGLSGFSVR